VRHRSCANGEKENLNRAKPAANQKISRGIKSVAAASEISIRPGRDPNYKAAPGAGEKDSILVQNITPNISPGNRLPASTDESPNLPAGGVGIENHVIAPTHAGPVYFEPLALEFGGCHLQRR